MSDPLFEMNNADQDLMIATLKAKAFDLTQRLRDYDSLNEQFMSLSAKFEMLKHEKSLN